jgi:hypothetical protein
MIRTLDELTPAWNRIIPAKNRFVNALDGTAVLDQESGLVWAKSPTSAKDTWYSALEYCTRLTLGGRKGWRLPTIEELASLVDPSNRDPALPIGHPFTVNGEYYWSSSTCVYDRNNAWIVHMPSGEVNDQYPKRDNNFNTWPVRGGTNTTLIYLSFP